MINDLYLTRLDRLKIELKGLLDREYLSQTKMEDIREDIETVREEIRMELERNYHL